MIATLTTAASTPVRSYPLRKGTLASNASDRFDDYWYIPAQPDGMKTSSEASSTPKSCFDDFWTLGEFLDCKP